MSQSFTRVSHVLADVPDEIAVAGGVLVTLVHTEGSAYQKAGAQLFVTAAKRVYGVVSGGCLEQAILDDAWEVGETEGKKLKIYETEGPDDIDFGFGMGCGGKLWVFIESVSDKLALNLARFGRDSSSPLIAVAVEGRGPLGQRKELDDDPRLAAVWAKLSQKTLSTLWTDGDTQYAVYRKSPLVNLSLFGAGPGSWPVAAFARQLGWTVTVYDHRPALLEDFPKQWATSHLMDRAATQLKLRVKRGREAALLMTHSFSMDQTLLETLEPGAWFYIGMMGSQKRLEKLWDLVKADCPLKQDPSCLYGPAGLDLGGTDTASIAIQMCSEIQAVLYQKPSLHKPSFAAKVRP